MSDYRRADQPGGTYFFTLVTYKRQPIFADAGTVDLLRAAVLNVMNERPFEFLAGVVLPDHAHYLWTLPPGSPRHSAYHRSHARQHVGKRIECPSRLPRPPSRTGFRPR